MMKDKDLILIVDDIEMNRLILKEILSDTYDTAEASNGAEAMHLLKPWEDAPADAVEAPNAANVEQNTSALEKPPSLILLDIIMPEMDGYEVLDRIVKSPTLNKIPVIFITAADANENESKGILSGAVDYISKPFNPEVVKARVKGHLTLRHYSESLEEQVEEKVAEIVKTKERMIEAIANMVEYRNLESGEHVKRTSALSRLLVEYFHAHPEKGREVSREALDIIPKAVPLHDIGKIGIADNILLKPGKLTDDEFKIMKMHSDIGANIIQGLRNDPDDTYLATCHDIVRFHHERWDGTGYPDGLKGENIPFPARIMAIADVYDALVNARVYKPAMTVERAEEIINEGSGTHFDPELVAAFNILKDKFRKNYE